MRDAAISSPVLLLRSPLVLIVGLGLALRIAWAVTVPVDPVSDSYAYHVFAKNIVDYGVFGWTPEEPTAYWPVGTSAVIASLYFLFGEDWTAIVIMNIAISCLIIIQTFMVGKMYFSTITGLTAAAVIALWPSMILFVTVIASELLFIFFILGGLLAFGARTHRWWVSPLVAGLFWAAATYVRPLALPMPVVIGFTSVIWGAMSVRESGAKVVVILVVIGVTLAPWAYRNYTVFGEPVLVSTNFGPTFWMGNHPGTNGGYTPLPEWTKGLSQSERDSRLTQEAMAYVAAEPGAFLWRTASKLVRLHDRETIGIAWNGPGIQRSLGSGALMPLKIVATGYWYIILLLSLCGVTFLAIRAGVLLTVQHPVFACWIYLAVFHAIVIINDRYHFPSIPFIAVLASLALLEIAGHPQRARTNQVGEG